MGAAAGSSEANGPQGARHRYVALLRGVNVGGRTVPMRRLRELFEALGHTDVVSYIQSGNVLFCSAREDRPALADEIRTAIDADIGQRVTVVLRSSPELERVVAANPFAERDDTAWLYVTFLERSPDPELLRGLDVRAGQSDEFRVVGREAYVWCPAGYGRTVLSNDFFERRLGVAATTRNWRTVMALTGMAAD